MPRAIPLTTGTPRPAANSASSRVMTSPWSLGCREPTIEICTGAASSEGPLPRVKTATGGSASWESTAG